jgi:LPS-assembly protein
MIRSTRAAACLLILVTTAWPAVAQAPPGWNSKQFRIEQIDTNHWRFTGQAELEDPNSPGTKFYADVVDLYTDQDRLEASGNVVYETADARISADRVQFNTKSQTGTFYEASGMASLGDRGARDKSMFGTLEPDVYFYGRELSKVGPDRYKISKGGFTTCVQPAPRWEVVSGNATINVGDYAILRNAVMRVKDVPIFYLPVLYYPIQDDDRATGFLLPTYGRSTYRGPSLSNAFFWAVSRSQDATFFHDWFTSRGQGAGTEYRYVTSPASNGTMRAYWLNEKAGTVDGVELPARRAWEANGGLTQALPNRWVARARVDYFSDISVQQLYNNNIYEASRRQRSVGGNVNGTYRGLNVAGTFQRTELFFDETSSVVSGQAPSVTTNFSSRRIGRAPLYVSFNGEAGRPVYVEKNASSEVDRSMGRVDMAPSLRAPIGNWPFLQLTGQAAYRLTWYSESLQNNVQVDESLTRGYFDLRADLVGPSFSRVYTPNNALADRLKHVIEPNLSIQRVTDIDNQDNVVLLGNSYDYVVGGVTRITYGITNRVLVRKAANAGGTAPGQAPRVGAPGDFLVATLSQSYYTDQRASLFDQTYQSSYNQRPPSNFSPVALQVRSQPAARIGNTLRLEYDAQASLLRALSLDTNINAGAGQASIGWSRRVQSTTFTSQDLFGNTRLDFLGGRVGGAYGINWDVARKTIVQQRMVAFYNAQCCGVAVEFQRFNFGAGAPVPADTRFNFSFTLAGIGSFSNFFGNMGGSSMGPYGR